MNNFYLKTCDSWHSPPSTLFLHYYMHKDKLAIQRLLDNIDMNFEAKIGFIESEWAMFSFVFRINVLWQLNHKGHLINLYHVVVTFAHFGIFPKYLHHIPAKLSNFAWFYRRQLLLSNHRSLNTLCRGLFQVSRFWSSSPFRNVCKLNLFSRQKSLKCLMVQLPEFILCDCPWNIQHIFNTLSPSTY